MRRLGDAAHLLGIKARDWDLFTVEETEHYLAWLDAYEKAQREANEKLKKGR
jgi:CHAD domain-containing protein